MYILVNKDDIQVASIRDAYHETMPDGRVILSGSLRAEERMWERTYREVKSSLSILL